MTRRQSPPLHPSGSSQGKASGQRLFRAGAPLPLPFSAGIRCRSMGLLRHRSFRVPQKGLERNSMCQTVFPVRYWHGPASTVSSPSPSCNSRNRSIPPRERFSLFPKYPGTDRRSLPSVSAAAVAPHIFCVLVLFSPNASGSSLPALRALPACALLPQIPSGVFPPRSLPLLFSTACPVSLVSPVAAAASPGAAFPFACDSAALKIPVSDLSMSFP